MKTTLMMMCCSLLVACGGDDGGEGGEGGVNPRTADVLDLTGDSTEGADVYTNTCGISSCHGPNGNDGSATAGDLGTLVPMLDEEQMVTTVLDGNGSMPPQSFLSDQDIADVVAYARERWP